MAGSGVQQTRIRRAEQAVEVVQNHVGGTRSSCGDGEPKERFPLREWTRDGVRRRGISRATPREADPRERVLGGSRLFEGESEATRAAR
jgi:hypothetical protein